MPVLAAALTLACSAAPGFGDQVIVKTIDRKFPVGWCPLESRGVDLSFVAQASTVRITFSANNQKGSTHNALHIDDVSVVLSSIFQNHLATTTGFNGCYQNSNGAPAYQFEYDGTAVSEVSQDVFPSMSGWTGSHLSFDGASSAPDHPLTNSPT